MGKIYFISGIDTGVGKTVATGMMARYLHKKGVNVITVKMVQTGNTGFSEDLDAHRKMMGCSPFPEDKTFLTAPQIFKFPASPHLAAGLEHRIVDCAAIRAAVETLARKYSVVLVEGAGGLHVPLTEELLTIDFAAENKWPLILVTSGKLGSLNHTLLSFEAALNRKMTVSGTVYNYAPDADPVIDEDTPRMIKKYLASHGCTQALVRVPRVGVSDGNYPDVDFSTIFGI